MTPLLPLVCLYWLSTSWTSGLSTGSHLQPLNSGPREQYDPVSSLSASLRRLDAELGRDLGFGEIQRDSEESAEPFQLRSEVLY